MAVSLLPLFVAGCFLDDDDDNNSPPPPETTPSASLRIIHASPDAPTVNVFAGDAILAGLENVDYQVASPRLTLDAGSYDVRVEANVPGGNIDVITQTLTLDGDTTYDVLAVDTVADEVEALIVENSASDIGAGNVRVQVVHAAPGAPAVDIYVTAPDADLAMAAALDTLAFREFTDQVEVAAGDYRIRITPEGQQTVVFDSATVPLAAGADLLIVATDNVSTGNSPVTLLVADGTGSAKIRDSAATAELRVVHAVSDAPAVDINANNALTLVDGAAFLATTAYLPLEPGDYMIDIATAGTDTTVVDDAVVTLEQGVFYTAIANGTLAGDAVDLDLLIDMPRAVATEAKVRIIHAAPSAGTVDIYVTADGEITDVDPAFSAVPYSTDALAETMYVALAEGAYVVTVTPTGSKDEALETSVLNLMAGGVYTAIAADGSMMGAGPQLILLDALDATPPTLGQPSLRVTHASPDAPTVNVFANGDALLNDVDYQTASAWLPVPADDYAVRVEANLPGAMTTDVITADLALAAGNTYEVLAIGSVGAGTLGPLVIENSAFGVAYDNVRVQVVHAAPQAPQVDIYVTAPDADLSDAQPVATASFGEFTGQLIVPAGDYQIRLTPAGDQTVVFDSGTVPLAAGADLLIAATENVATGTSPVSLLVADGTASSVILDGNAQAHIRVVHAAADAPVVDVIANNAVTLVDGAAFLDATDYITVDAGNYLLDIAADADGAVVIDDAPVTLAAGVFYTAIANNTLAALDLDLLTDTPRAVATEARVRIIHASPGAGNVDIYVSADGEIGAIDPAFPNVPYNTGTLAETGYVGLAAGDYVVTVTAAGSKVEALETGVLSLQAGMIYTAIAVDGNMLADPPQLILLDGLATP
ncbi:DUF4397 domain-containing protein [Exilibacterium tricleocarpae]|uniref:DUF4397 domain-containing protein n=1 Tax=Exilibacterium tricleocarpae TaxID=2591008 RepID=UPI001C551294|nr:DUF4397 domain-containing protein [Exilibacterium tricleocarpae]